MGDGRALRDELRRLRCCVTGQELPLLKRPEDDIKVDLENCILRAAAEGFTTFISGLDCGVDIWAAEIVVRLRLRDPKLHLVAAVPFPGFDEEWEEGWRARYRLLLSQAEYVKVLEPGPSGEAFRKRNEWMVAHSARVIAVYGGQPGDTRNAIRYARLCRVPVILLSG